MVSGIHRATNAARRAAHCKLVVRDRLLDAVAQKHAADMAARGYYSHTTPEGLDPTGRAAAVEYNCRKRTGDVVWTGVAENIYTIGPRAAYSEGTAAGAVRSWLRSPGHRRNILDSRYSRLGVGVAIGARGAIYAVQNFC